MAEAKIIITVSGGVCYVASKTPGVELVIRDFDVEGCDARVIQAPNGDRYVESVWAADEEV